MKRIWRMALFFTVFWACLLGIRPVSASIECKKIVWITSLAGQMTRYTELLRVALQSAALKAPSVVPVIVAEGSSLATPEMQSFVRHVESKGAIVTPHTLTFLRDFKADSHQYRVRGAFTRLECGLIVKRLLEQKRLDPQDVDTEYTLYADSDIMFLQDMNSCSLSKPAIALLGPEAQKGSPQNTGVLYINVSAWNAEHVAVVEHARARGWDFIALDQGLIKDFYGSRLGLLPDHFNWKGYWGEDKNAVILHFHGPKPGPCLECLCTHSTTEASDACDPEGCNSLSRDWSSFYKDQTLDEGSYFRTILMLYYRYLADDLSMQYKVKVKRHEIPVG